MSIEIQGMAEKLIVITIELDYSKVLSKNTVPTYGCRVDWGKEPTLRTNAHNFLHGLCIPEHYASKCVKESNQDKKQCYSTNIYNTKQLIKK